MNTFPSQQVPQAAFGHYLINKIERPETSKCSRQQNQLNKTLTNFRQKQGMGGGGGGVNEQQQQSANINMNSGQQQYSLQKNQPLPPSMINIPNGIISDRQQSRSGTRQGRNNNTSFQTTGQGFFKETFYREPNNNGNNNNNSMVFNNSNSSNSNMVANNNKINSSNNNNNNNNNTKNNTADTEEGITLDKYFGSNFQVINLGINNEEKPNKSTISSYMGNQLDQAQQNQKFNKIQSNFEENKQGRSNRMSKDEQIPNGGEGSQSRVKRPSKIQAQSSFIDDNSGEYKDYMEEEFEIHETDEEYSESNRESQADLNINDANNDDFVQKTNKSKRKSIEDRNRDKSQNNQDQSLTSKSIKQYLNTQESGDEKQIHIQKKLRDKYSKKMRHKPFNTTNLQSHQNSTNNNLDASNQPSSTTSSNSQKNQSISQQIQQQQSINQQQQPYLIQYQSSNNNNPNISSYHDNNNNNYQTYNSGKGKYSTNNTSQSYNTNYSTNFNSNVTVSGQNERGSLTLIDDQSQINKTDFDSFNPKSGQSISNNSNSNIFNSNNPNSQQQQAQKKYKSNNDDSIPQYKTYNYFAGNRKEGTSQNNGKEQNLNNSYILSKQQHQQSFNHSTSLNQTDNTNDLQPQNSSQIDKTTKNYNIRKINKSQSPPVRDPFQPLITHQRNFSRDTAQLQNQHSFQLNNQNSHNNNNSSSSSSMQNTINQANLASNTNSSNNNNNLIKSNASNMINNMNQFNGVNNSQILNSQSGESFKQNNNMNIVAQQNNSHVKANSNINQGIMNTGNINATIQSLQRKSKYGEFLDSQQSNNDKLTEMQKQFRTSFYHVKQQSMQHQNQQQNQNQSNDPNNFAQTSTSFANVVAAANAIQGFPNNGQNPILAPLNSLPTNNSYYNATSKNRLTLNEFYKHQSKYEDYGQPSGPPNINQYEEFIADNLMRRTAKENKFLNQKEKLNELIKQEDINFVTKYAARFNLNNDECQQLIQTGKQEKVQIKKRMETPHKGFRGDFQQTQQKKKLSVTKEPKQPPSNNNPTLINRPQNDNNNQYQSKERNSVLF